MFGYSGPELLNRQRSHSSMRRSKPNHHPGSSLAGTVECLQEQVGDLPPYALLLGTSQDGAYLFLDLTDPRPGSILIIGDQDCGKGRLLRSLLASAAAFNPPRRIRFGLVTPRPDLDPDLVQLPHCYRVTVPEPDEIADLVQELQDILAQRRLSRQAGTAIILAFHELASAARQMDRQTVEELGRLVREGPASLVWVVATLETQEVNRLPPALIEGFGTLLMGKMQSPQFSSRLAQSFSLQTDHLAPGKQFSILYDTEWINFWIPCADQQEERV